MKPSVAGIWSRPASLSLVGIVLLALFGVNSVALAQKTTVSRSAGDYAARLARIERLLDGQALFDLSNRIEALQLEMQQMRGELESQAYALEQMRNRQRDLYVDIDQRLQGAQLGPGRVPAAGPSRAPIGTFADPANPPLDVLPGLNPITGADEQLAAATPLAVEQIDTELNWRPITRGPALPEASAEAATIAVVTPVASPRTRLNTVPAPVDETQAEAEYRAALSLLKIGRYDQSKAAFDGFLVEYPSSAYADNAQYWLGEAYYVTRDFEPAMQEYTKLVQAFPESQKVEYALLKIAYCHQELGNLSAAIAQLEELTNLYPGGSAARKAQDRLQQLRFQ